MKIVVDSVEVVRNYIRDFGRKLKIRKENSYLEIRKLEDELSASIEHAPEQDHTTTRVAGQFAWKFWLIGAGTALLGYFLFQSLDIIYLILTAFVISMAIENVIRFFQRRCSRGVSMLISYLLLLIFAFLGLLIVVPFLVQQFADLITVLIDRVSIIQQTIQHEGLETIITKAKIPGALKSSLLKGIEDGGRVLTFQNALIDNASQIVGAGTGYIKNAGGAAVSVVSGFFTGIFKFTITFVMAVFFSIEKEKVITVIANISGRAKYTKLKLLKLYKKLGFRLEGQLILCLCVGVAVWVGLTIVGWFGVSLPDKGSLALIAGLTEFIPYLGPFIGMVPAILVGIASYGFKGLIVVLILYWIIQQSENNILVPMVMNRTLGISPLIIFISMIVGGTIFGFLGVLMAVPIAVVINILFEEYGKEPKDDQLKNDKNVEDKSASTKKK